MPVQAFTTTVASNFSALQRAEIAETLGPSDAAPRSLISVLFNEPKLLKTIRVYKQFAGYLYFSALQRAEIAEINTKKAHTASQQISVLFNEPKLLKPDLRSTPHPCSISQ